MATILPTEDFEDFRDVEIAKKSINTIFNAELNYIVIWLEEKDSFYAVISKIENGHIVWTSYAFGVTEEMAIKNAYLVRKEKLLRKSNYERNGF